MLFKEALMRPESLVSAPAAQETVDLACTDLALCKAIIVMAHQLGIKVVAEGVETEQQRDLLVAAGCDFGQGYLFSRPLLVPDFEAFMASREG